MNPASVYVYAPQGQGKTASSAELAALLGCGSIVDNWDGIAPVPDNALVLTNIRPTFPCPVDLSRLDPEWAARKLFPRGSAHSLAPYAASADAGRAGGEVGQHLSGGRVEALVGGSGLKESADLANVSLAAGGDGEEQVL